MDKDGPQRWPFIALCSSDHYMLAIKLTEGRTSRSIGHIWSIDAPHCHTLRLSDSLLGLRVRSFIVQPCPHTHVGTCYKVTCYKVSPCDFVACTCVCTGVLQSHMRLYSMQLCTKLLGGRGLTHAAFYQISTDSMLVWSLSGSLVSCLASLRPFIEMLRSLVTA